jgi:Kef-type K+ transport system membrane component KefB
MSHEVEILLALIVVFDSAQAGVITEGMYAAIIAMSLLTSVVAPPALTALFRLKCETESVPH